MLVSTSIYTKRFQRIQSRPVPRVQGIYDAGILVMKLEFIKQAGGNLTPADDFSAEKLLKFKTGGQYTVDIKRTRNPVFHQKMFVFFKFCFDHWAGGHEFQDESTQFDSFRKQLTITAGYYDQVFNLNKTDFTLEARSLSFGNMEQEEFEQCYHSIIQAAMTSIFKTADDQQLAQLMRFF